MDGEKLKREIIEDESSGHAKTSIRMTRSMSEDIGLKVKKVLEDIQNHKIDFSYAEWQWFVTQCFSDEIWIGAINKAIYQASIEGLSLNDNGAFLQLMAEKAPVELKAEFRKVHPVARLALMELLDKKPQKKPRKTQYPDVWLTPEERKRLYKQEELD